MQKLEKKKQNNAAGRQTNENLAAGVYDLEGQGTETRKGNLRGIGVRQRFFCT